MARQISMTLLKGTATHRLPTPKAYSSYSRIQGDHNNSKMERMNGEVRDREKVMRGLKTADTEILPGYQTAYGQQMEKTPKLKCGIKIEGENKWQTVIQNAVKQEGIEEE